MSCESGDARMRDWEEALTDDNGLVLALLVRCVVLDPLDAPRLSGAQRHTPVLREFSHQSIRKFFS